MIANVGETSTGDKAYVSGTDDSYVHENGYLGEWCFG
jgi:hypothetical protein